MKRRLSPIAVLLLLIAFASPGCGSSAPVANDTPQRQLVRESTDVNLIAKAVYSSLVAAHKAGQLSDGKLIALEPVADAAEAGRKQLTADALAGNVTKADATKNAVLSAVGQLSAALLESSAPATQPAVPH